MPIPQQLARFATGLLTLAFAAALTTPAQAFSLKLPQAVKDTFRTLLAQEGPVPAAPDGQGALGQFQPQPGQSGPVSGSIGQFQPQPNFDANQVGPNQFGQPNQNQFGGNQFQQVKEGVGPLRNDLNKFDGMVKDAERRGQPIPQQTKNTLQKTQTTIDSVRRAQNPEEVQNIDMDELESDVQDLEMERRRLEEEKRGLAQMKKGMLQMEKGLKQFETQIARLAKQKINVPAEVKDTLAKIKTILAAVKAAKTFDEAEAAGIQDLQELMQGLDEARHQLEALARWPQAARQITQQIKKLDSELKRAKTVVDRLAKQKIDLTDEYTAFAEAVKKLKETAGVATAQVASGTTEGVEEAFDLLENEFFGQIEEAFQHVQVIQTMGNLGRFASDLKRNLAQTQQRINQLKRQKIDTTALQEIYNEAKTQGNEVLALLKTKPIDNEAIQEGLQELENLKQQFEETAQAASGQETDLPWEGGKDQFQAIQLSPDISKFIPTKQEVNTDEPIF